MRITPTGREQAKKLAKSMVPEGERLDFYDVGRLESAAASVKELGRSTGVAVRKNAPRLAIMGAVMGVGAPVGRPDEETAAVHHAIGLYPGVRVHVAVVTDRSVRLVEAILEDRAGRPGRFVRAEGSEEMVFAREGSGIQVGEVSTGGSRLAKDSSIQVTFPVEGGPLVLHFSQLDDWQSL